MGIQNDGRTVRNYLFALTDGGGTIPPELGVVRRLVARGHRVSVLADASMATEALATGARFTPWSGEPSGPIEDWKKMGPQEMARMTVEYMITGPAPGQIRDTLAALDTLEPHRVVTSFTAFGAMLAAEARGVEFSVLLPNIYPMPAKGLPPLAMGLAPARGALGAARDALLNRAGGWLVDRLALETLNTLRTEHGLGPLARTWDQVHRATSELLLTSSSFDFPAELPANARYAGPILDDPGWAGNSRWEPPEGDQPLVLVAMSSTFQNQAECLQRIADALGGLPVRAVLTSGPAIETGEIIAPANVTVVGAAPHRQVMATAKLVITHGGHGTVLKSLAAGVPLLILHHGRDQAENASRVTRRGAGISIPRKAPAPKIDAAVTRILDTDSYKLAAEELGKRVAAEAASDQVLMVELGA